MFGTEVLNNDKSTTYNFFKHTIARTKNDQVQWVTYVRQPSLDKLMRRVNQTFPDAIRRSYVILSLNLLKYIVYSPQHIINITVSNCNVFLYWCNYDLSAT